MKAKSAVTGVDASRTQVIRERIERNMKALTLRPSVGQGTATTRTRLIGGLACEVEEGRWRLNSDLTDKVGGTNSAPNPGVIGRAALGCCLATSYAIWAAQLGIPLNSLEVVVEADYDARGMFGLDGVPPGYSQIRYTVIVDSDAGDEEVMQMIERSDACCDFLAVFRDPQDVRREVRLTGSSPKDTGTE